MTPIFADRNPRATVSRSAGPCKLSARRLEVALTLIFPNLSGPYYSEVIYGFEREAVQARQSVLILGARSARLTLPPGA